jgi:hypothetical protein
MAPIKFGFVSISAITRQLSGLEARSFTSYLVPDVANLLVLVSDKTEPMARRKLWELFIDTNLAITVGFLLAHDSGSGFTNMP